MELPSRRVEFVKVGRGRVSWTDSVPLVAGVLDERAMVKSVRKHARPASREVWIENADGGASGIVFAGMHSIGGWKLSETPDVHP